MPNPPGVGRAGIRPTEANRAVDAYFSTAEAHGNYLPWQAQSFWEALHRRYQLGDMPYMPFIGDRVAPDNPYHQQTVDEIHKAEVADALKDDARMARNALSRSQHTNARDEVNPLLEKALGNPQGYVESYLNNITRPMMQVMRDEAKHNFIEEVMPSTNASFTRAGAFYGGARQHALAKQARHAQEHLHREMTKLGAQAEHNARQFAGEHAQRHLHAADIKRGLAHEDRQSLLATAQERRHLHGETRAAHQQKIAQLSTEAARRKQHEQAKIDASVREHNAEMEYPHEQNRRDLAAATAVPSMGGQGFGSLVSPPPRSRDPYTQASGLMGQGLGLASLESPLKKGGRVKRKFADGGMPTLDQVQHTPETHEMAHLAGRIGKTLNPRAMVLARMGSALSGASPYESPMAAQSKGFDEGLDAYERIHDSNAIQQLRSVDALKAIQKSRQDQHQVLMDYKKFQDDQARRAKEFEENLGEQKRLHSSQIGLNEAHRNYYEAQANAKEAPPLKLDSTDTHILKRNADTYESAQGLLTQIKTMKELAPKIMSGGPLGVIPAWTDTDKEEFDKTSVDLVTKLRDLLKKSGRGIKELEALEKGKPTRWVTPEGNIRNLDKMEKMIMDQLKAADFINDAVEHGVPPKKAQAAYSKYERLKDKNPDVDPFELLGIKGKKWSENEGREQEVEKDQTSREHQSKDDDYSNAEIMAALQ